MLMLDTVDFPVVFWGALRAGVVPVPINTLLTAGLVGYILADSRAEAIVISAPLLPACCRFCATLRVAANYRLGAGRFVAGSIDDPRAVAFEDFLAGGEPETPAVARLAGRGGVLAVFVGLDRRAERACGTCMAACARPRRRTARRCCGSRPDDVMFSAAKAFHAYGLGNAMTFPMSVGARAVLLPDRPTPDAVLETMRRSADHLRRRADAVRVVAGAIRRSGRARARTGCGAASPPARRCPSDIGVRWRAVVGVDILDGIGSTEMLHIFCQQPPGRRALRHQRRARAGLRARWWSMNTAGRCRTARRANWWCAGPARRMGTGTSARRARRTFRGEWTLYRRYLYARCRRVITASTAAATR